MELNLLFVIIFQFLNTLVGFCMHKCYQLELMQHLSDFLAFFDQEVSSMLLQKLVTAGIGDRPVVFITHRYVSF